MLERIRVRRAWGVSVLTAAVALVVVIALGSAGGGVAGAKSGPLVAASAKLVPISPIIKPSNPSCARVNSSEFIRHGSICAGRSRWWSIGRSTSTRA